MINPAGIEDVRGVIERPLTADEERVIPNWLNKAWRELQRVVPGIPDRVTLPVSADGYLATADVIDVLAAMVERKTRNAAGLRSWSTDDYDQTVDSALSSGQIYVSESEKDSLAVRTVGASNQIFSITLTTRP